MTRVPGSPRGKPLWPAAASHASTFRQARTRKRRVRTRRPPAQRRRKASGSSASSASRALGRPDARSMAATCATQRTRSFSSTAPCARGPSAAAKSRRRCVGHRAGADAGGGGKRSANGLVDGGSERCSGRSTTAAVAATA